MISIKSIIILIRVMRIHRLGTNGRFLFSKNFALKFINFSQSVFFGYSLESYSKYRTSYNTPKHQNDDGYRTDSYIWQSVTYFGRSIDEIDAIDVVKEPKGISNGGTIAWYC